MLMLPDPTRSFKTTPIMLPVAAAKKFAVTQVGFAPESELTGVIDRGTFVPSWVEIANQGDTEAIGVDARWHRIQKIYRPNDVHRSPHFFCHRPSSLHGATVGGPTDNAGRARGTSS